MKSTSKPIIFGIVGVALAFVVLPAVRPYIFHPSTQIGDFVVPTLSGWSKSIRTTPRSQSVHYLKRDGKNRLAIDLFWDLDKSTASQTTVQDLQKDLDRDMAAVTSLMKTAGGQIQTSASQPVAFGGMPAVKSEITATTVTQTLHGRYIKFVKGRNCYKLSRSISNHPAGDASADLQSEMDKAYAIVTDSLTSKPSAPL